MRLSLAAAAFVLRTFLLGVLFVLLKMVLSRGRAEVFIEPVSRSEGVEIMSLSGALSRPGPALDFTLAFTLQGFVVGELPLVALEVVELSLQLQVLLLQLLNVV